MAGVGDLQHSLAGAPGERPLQLLGGRLRRALQPSGAEEELDLAADGYLHVVPLADVGGARRDIQDVEPVHALVDIGDWLAGVDDTQCLAAAGADTDDGWHDHEGGVAIAGGAGAIFAIDPALHQGGLAAGVA
ncbi:hypothetical protein D3C81_1316930 [compost metagenome]